MLNHDFHVAKALVEDRHRELRHRADPRAQRKSRLRRWKPPGRR